MTDNNELEITAMKPLTDDPMWEPERDKLNRKTFAKNLTKSLFSYSEDSCFTAGRYGQWGSGKSSLLNLVEKE